MQIYESAFISIAFDEETKFFERHWTEQSEHLTDEQFQFEMLKVLEIIQTYQPKLVLGDTKHFSYIVLPEMQIWLDNNVYSQLNLHNVEKMAFVQSKDIVSAISIEQSIEESDKHYQVRYFESEEEARTWLFEH